MNRSLIAADGHRRTVARAVCCPAVLAAWLGLTGPLAADEAPAEAPAVERQQKVHAGLYELATSSEDGTLWVAATGSAQAPGAYLIALDPETLQERRRIDLGENPALGVAINNRTQTLYSSNTRVGNMSAVDLRTGEVTLIERADVEDAPHLYRVVVDEQNNRVYATVASTPGSIWVVDGAANELVDIIEDVGDRPTGLVLDAEAGRLYATILAANEVAVIELDSGKVVDRIPTDGERSTQLAFDPATQRLFVGNQETNDVTVIDAHAGRVVRKIPTGAQPIGVAFHPKTNQLYVASRQDGTVTVIDTQTYERVADLPIGSNPNSIHVDAATGIVYVANKAARPAPGQRPADDPRGDMVTLIRP